MDKVFKILVVDDEPDIVEILTYNLEKEKFIVSKAFNGKECIEQAKNIHPDLIIMDVRMPGMDGIETCRNLQLIESLRSIPVLFLTADSDEFTSLKAFDAGGSHFVTKPIKPSVLVSMIKELLQ